MEFVFIKSDALNFDAVKDMGLEQILEMDGAELMKLVVGDKKDVIRVVKEEDIPSQNFTQEEKEAMEMAKLNALLHEDEKRHNNEER